MGDGGVRDFRRMTITSSTSNAVDKITWYGNKQRGDGRVRCSDIKKSMVKATFRTIEAEFRSFFVVVSVTKFVVLKISTSL